MLTKTLLILCILILFKYSLTIPSRNYNFVVENFTCESFLKNIIKLKCEMFNIARNQYVFSLEIVFFKIIEKDLFLHYFVEAKPPARNKTIKFIDFKVNFCDGVQSDITMISESIIKLRKISNIPFGCPLKANFPYNVNNFTFTDQSLPRYLPFIDFVQGIYIYDSNVKIGIIKTVGSLVPKSKSKKIIK
ncbi:hypothetical protein CVS40_10629 [Lucilia cuprina]|nr:hypothetical protein CVS40_10629 [Lucilia cuprina]